MASEQTDIEWLMSLGAVQIHLNDEGCVEAQVAGAWGVGLTIGDALEDIRLILGREAIHGKREPWTS